MTSMHSGGPILTGLSGNEIYCLKWKGYAPGNIVIGNSVFSMGFLGGISSSMRGLVGGEIPEVTGIIQEGRHEALQRLTEDARQHSALGVTGVTSELVNHAGNIEFLSVGSAIHTAGKSGEAFSFSTSADGQELFCQLDCGFQPIRFVIGNVAYALGVGKGITSAFKKMARGEIKEYSDIFNQTRHLAISRIEEEARAADANAVVGIRTTITRFYGTHEMLMVGTASYHPALRGQMITSDLTNEEMWNIVNLGYVPIRLVLGASVYSLGIVGGIKSMFKSFVRGEISELTTLIYEARENALAHLKTDAAAAGADDIVGVKTYVYELDGLIEFLAIGTAIKKMDGVKTASDQLPPQAIIRDKDTFIDAADFSFGVELNKGR